MQSTTWRKIGPLLTGVALMAGWCAMNARSVAEETAPASPPAETKQPEEEKPLKVDEARRQAKLAHQIYGATLEVMHERYFHDDRAMVPARALEDVFQTIDKQSKIQARWISVNTKPMSINHTPKSEFEKRAAKEIGDGQESVELIADGYYHRASAIPLSAGCVSCHNGFFTASPKTPRFAALVIRMPVKDE